MEVTRRRVILKSGKRRQLLMCLLLEHQTGTNMLFFFRTVVVGKWGRQVDTSGVLLIRGKYFSHVFRINGKFICHSQRDG
jgi:hypothetical protein